MNIGPLTILGSVPKVVFYSGGSMNTKIILALFLITFMFVDTGCSHHRPVARRPAVIVVAQTPPPPRYEIMVVSPGPRHAWVPGHWSWNNGWNWVSGRWVHPPHRHARWVPGYWGRHRSGYVWFRGYWR